MSESKYIQRGAMTPEERSLRSQLKKLVTSQGLLHGTLISRMRVCGGANCKCTRGELHEGLYLIVTENNKPRQLYVPKKWKQTVQQWIDNYKEARELMDEISRIHWDKVRNRQD